MIDDKRVDELRRGIVDDLHATSAARELLSWACFFIQTGTPAPQRLRDLIADGLEHLESHDPLRAFGHIYSPPPKRGRPAKESNRELTNVFRAILQVHRGGVPLVARGERYPFKILEGTAFSAYVAEHFVGNEAASKKEARRLQAAFWKRVRALPLAQQEALGVAQYLPRKKC